MSLCDEYAVETLVFFNCFCSSTLGASFCRSPPHKSLGQEEKRTHRALYLASGTSRLISEKPRNPLIRRLTGSRSQSDVVVTILAKSSLLVISTVVSLQTSFGHIQTTTIFPAVQHFAVNSMPLLIIVIRKQKVNHFTNNHIIRSTWIHVALCTLSSSVFVLTLSLSSSYCLRRESDTSFETLAGHFIQKDTQLMKV